MRRRRGRLALLLAILAVATLTGCWGAGENDDTLPPMTSGAKVVRVDWIENATGEVDYCTDPSGARRRSVRDFNRAFAARGLSARVEELPDDTAEQHRMFVEREISCDVFDSDVIWIAELAAQKRLYDMTPYIDVDVRGRTFISTTLKTADFERRWWGVPHTTNAGFLFYRKDDVAADHEPATWQAVYHDAATKRGIVYQAARSEGLTVNYLELAFAAGGRVLSKDGARSVINSPKNIGALQLMVDGIKNGTAPKRVLRYDEDGRAGSSRRGRRPTCAIGQRRMSSASVRA